jgi:hypothetical protein
VRQRPATLEHYLRIAPNEQLVTDYAVGQHYPLEARQEYRVAVRRPVVEVQIAGKSSVLEVHCGVGNLYPSTQHESLGISQEPLHADSGCSATQAQQINQLDSVARSAAFASRKMIFSGSELYYRWFGDWSTGNGDVVDDYIQRYRTLDWAVRCGGGDCADHPSWIAYVHHPAVGSDTMYVCNPWWSMSASSSKFQSRVGVLIHEDTHLDAAGLPGTADIVDQGSCAGSCYGSAAARNLAQDPTCTGGSSSCKAIRNAENFGFFGTDGLIQTIVATTL